MNNRRINRISEEVRRAVSEIISNDLKDPRVDVMTTVTEVEVTRDLSYANIYISVLGDETKKRESMEGLEKAKGFIRTGIGQKVDLRHVPEPVFHLDETTEQALKLRELISKVSEEDNKNKVEKNE